MAKYWLMAVHAARTVRVSLDEAANLLSSREPTTVAVHAAGRIRTDSSLCRCLLRIRHLLRHRRIDGDRHGPGRIPQNREAADLRTDEVHLLAVADLRRPHAAVARPYVHSVETDDRELGDGCAARRGS